jgi:hypothetical protein
MVRDIKPFVAIRIPPWLDLRALKQRAEEGGITEEEARKEFLKEAPDVVS